MVDLSFFPFLLLYFLILFFCFPIPSSPAPFRSSARSLPRSAYLFEKRWVGEKAKTERAKADLYNPRGESKRKGVSTTSNIERVAKEVRGDLGKACIDPNQFMDLLPRGRVTCMGKVCKPSSSLCSTPWIRFWLATHPGTSLSYVPAATTKKEGKSLENGENCPVPSLYAMLGLLGSKCSRKSSRRSMRRGSTQAEQTIVVWLRFTI